MRCKAGRETLLDVARGGAYPAALRAHVGSCAECARFLQEQQALSAALAALAAEEPARPEEFAAPVMAELGRARPAGGHSWRWGLAAGMAAAIGLAVIRMGTPSPAPPEAERPFVAIPYTVPLAPEEHATVTRMQIPVTALIAAGFHVAAANPGAVVEADVLAAEDGRVRAIRIVN